MWLRSLGEHVDLDEISKTVRECKGAHHAPRAIHVVDELPKLAAGKIDKRHCGARTGGEVRASSSERFKVPYCPRIHRPNGLGESLA